MASVAIIPVLPLNYKKKMNLNKYNFGQKPGSLPEIYYL